MEQQNELSAHRLEKMDAKLDALIDAQNEFRFDMSARFGMIDARLARIETPLDAKASASEVADLRGSVRSLPTVWQLITLVFGVLAGAFAIARFGLPHP